MIGAARKPMVGVYRTWSDGKCVHLLVRITGGNLGREPVTMHSKTELAPVRSAVRGQLAARESAMAGDPVEVEALATRVGGFGLFRRIGRAAKGAVERRVVDVARLELFEQSGDQRHHVVVHMAQAEFGAHTRRIRRDVLASDGGKRVGSADATRRADVPVWQPVAKTNSETANQR